MPICMRSGAQAVALKATASPASNERVRPASLNKLAGIIVSMKNRLILLAILFGIASAVSAQASVQDDPAVSRFVRALAAVDIPAAHVSVVAQPLSTGTASGGKTWSLNPGALRLTASTAKLYTTYATLVRLGPATTLKTEVWQNQPTTDGQGRSG